MYRRKYALIYRLLMRNRFAQRVVFGSEIVTEDTTADRLQTKSVVKARTPVKVPLAHQVNEPRSELQGAGAMKIGISMIYKRVDESAPSPGTLLWNVKS